MRRWLLLFPGALEGAGQTPLFDSPPNALRPVLERGRIVRLAASALGTPEAAWIGLDPAAVSAEPGPLLIAALGAHPPEGAVSLHLSLLSTDGTSVSDPSYLPTPQEQVELMRQAKRLETSQLKVVEGRGLDHGLVWEDGSIELGIQPPPEAEKRGMAASLPEGDGEPLLRRFIDDSVNLLSELELNAIRIEEGLPPLNVLWPWGPGFTPKLPNLTVERGRSVRADGPSVRFSGLCRLAGYRHGDPWALGTGTNLRFETMAESARNSDAWLGVVPTVGEFREAGRLEEAEWLGREALARLAAPLAEVALKDPIEMQILATDADGMGLALTFRSSELGDDGALSMRTEVAHDSRLRSRPLFEFVAEALG